MRKRRPNRVLAIGMLIAAGICASFGLAKLSYDEILVWMGQTDPRDQIELVIGTFVRSDGIGFDLLHLASAGRAVWYTNTPTGAFAYTSCRYRQSGESICFAIDDLLLDDPDSIEPEETERNSGGPPMPPPMTFRIEHGALGKVVLRNRKNQAFYQCEGFMPLARYMSQRFGAEIVRPQATSDPWKVYSDEAIRDVEFDLTHPPSLAGPVRASDGWVTCPICKGFFNSRSRLVYNGTRHLTCRHRLQVIDSN